MKYGKLKDGKLIENMLLSTFNIIVVDGKPIHKPTEADILAAGYLPIAETEEPTAKEGFVKSFRWVQTDSAIVKKWTVKRDMRPLSQTAVTNMLIARQINTLSVDDNTALRMRAFYPEWEPGTDYTRDADRPAGYKVRHGDKLWKLRTEHTSQTGWEPGNIGTETLWEQVNETHAGTIDDPIPYNGNMVLVNGKYYTQNDIICLCTRDTQIPVYNALADLVGLYVEET